MVCMSLVGKFIILNLFIKNRKRHKDSCRLECGLFDLLLLIIIFGIFASIRSMIIIRYGFKIQTPRFWEENISFLLLMLNVLSICYYLFNCQSISILMVKLEFVRSSFQYHGVKFNSIWKRKIQRIVHRSIVWRCSHI